jgi:hypothetical protein
MTPILHTAPTSNYALLKNIANETNPIIGFIQNRKDKGFFEKTDYKGTRYRFPMVGFFEDGNSSNYFGGDDNSLKNALKSVDPNVQLFLFDTPRELFKWLSE